MSRIAYIISAYKDAPHLSRLIKALDEDADFYVHIDRKADSRPFKELLPEGKVTFVQSHWVSWGGWEQVEYQKELLAAVLHSGIEYTRIVCLSGQDYPLWPNRKIHRYFEEHRDTEFIMGMNLTRSADKRQIAKIVYYHFFRDLKWENLWLKNKFIVASRHLMKWLPIRKAPIVRIGNKESDIYCGSDYWGITLPCAQYVYEKLCTEKELVRYFKTSFVPSELCIQTLVFNSPFAARALSVEGGYTGLSALTPLHYIIYGKSIKVLTLEDWSALQQSGKMFCLNSLRQSEQQADVVVIDNASQDRTVSLIESRYPEVRLIKSKENLGFGRANNIGMKIALKEGYDAVFLLNQDAWIDAKVLGELSELSRSHPRYGILSPIHLTGSGEKLEQGFAGYSNLSNLEEVKKQELKIRQETNGQSGLIPLPFVNAAFWMIPCNVLRTVGGFSPLFYHYGEDVDYANRIKHHGYLIGYSPKVFGCHDRENRTISHEVFLRSEQIYHLTEYANINYSFKKAFGYSVLACVKKSLIALVKGKAKTAGTYVIITTRLLKRTAEVRKFRKQSKLRNANYLQ